MSEIIQTSIKLSTLVPTKESIEQKITDCTSVDIKIVESSYDVSCKLQYTLQKDGKTTFGPSIVEDYGAYTEDYLPILPEISSYYVKTIAHRDGNHTNPFCFYDENKNFIGRSGNKYASKLEGNLQYVDGIFNFKDEYELSNAKYTRVSFYDELKVHKAADYLSVQEITYRPIQNIQEAIQYLSSEIVNGLESIPTSYMQGKNYVAAGDSFTIGIYDGQTRTPEEAAKLVYPYHIATRNKMNLKNIAVSGSLMCNPLSSRAAIQNRTVFPINTLGSAQNIQAIADANYMTIALGINDFEILSDYAQYMDRGDYKEYILTKSDSVIGLSTDSCLSTIWGAWNNSLSTILSVNNKIKLGIIINDDLLILKNSIRETIKNVGKVWGIPVLDFAGDPNVPSMLKGKYPPEGMNPYAVLRRDQVFGGHNPTSLCHPSVFAHEYKSTIIENYLRSL